MELYCAEFDSVDGERSSDQGPATSRRLASCPQLTSLAVELPTSAPLAAALIALGTAGMSRARREEAARSTLRILGAWAIPHFNRIFRSALSKLAADERREIVQNALDDVVITACKCGFRGDNERAAHAWARNVMRLRILTALRDRPRIPIDYSTSFEPELHAAPEPEIDRETLQRFLTMIEDEALRFRRPKDRESLKASIRIYVQSCCGENPEGTSTLENSVTVFDVGAAEVEQKRARDLVYQRRRRGKLVLQKALETLHSSSSWDPCYSFVVRALGLDLPERGSTGHSKK
jgi:hypothetical protein